MNPLISVIIPTYNRARMIKRAVESVLAQSYKNFEIIVVDDGSTDGTKEALSEYINKGEIKYILQNNAGPGVARNNGIQKARGELVAFLDSDDEWMPDKLEKQVKVFQQKGDDIIVFSNMEYINERGEKIGELFQKTRPSDGMILKQLLSDNFISTSSVVAPRSIILKAGGFAKNNKLFSIGEEHILWLKLASSTEFCYIQEPLVRYHIHSGQIISSKFRILSSLFFELIYLFKNAGIFNNLTRIDILSAFIKKFFRKLF